MRTELKRGDPAPDFELPDADGETWRLSDLTGTKVVLYFYPVDETPGCTAQACDFRDAMESFAQGGYRVLGVSPQDARSHRSFAANHDLNFPLLVDEGGRVAQAYGVWRRLGEGADARWGNLRSTFVIDEKGVLEHVEYGVKWRGSVGRLLDSLMGPTRG